MINFLKIKLKKKNKENYIRVNNEMKETIASIRENINKMHENLLKFVDYFCYLFGFAHYKELITAATETENVSELLETMEDLIDTDYYTKSFNIIENFIAEINGKIVEESYEVTDKVSYKDKKYAENLISSDCYFVQYYDNDSKPDYPVIEIKELNDNNVVTGGNPKIFSIGLAHRLFKYHSEMDYYFSSIENASEMNDFYFNEEIANEEKSIIEDNFCNIGVNISLLAMISNEFKKIYDKTYEIYIKCREQYSEITAKKDKDIYLYDVFIKDITDNKPDAEILTNQKSLSSIKEAKYNIENLGQSITLKFSNKEKIKKSKSQCYYNSKKLFINTMKTKIDEAIDINKLLDNLNKQNNEIIKYYNNLNIYDYIKEIIKNTSIQDQKTTQLYESHPEQIINASFNIVEYFHDLKKQDIERCILAKNTITTNTIIDDKDCKFFEGFIKDFCSGYTQKGKNKPWNNGITDNFKLVSKKVYIKNLLNCDNDIISTLKKISTSEMIDDYKTYYNQSLLKDSSSKPSEIDEVTNTLKKIIETLNYKYYNMKIDNFNFSKLWEVYSISKKQKYKFNIIVEEKDTDNILSNSLNDYFYYVKLHILKIFPNDKYFDKIDEIFVSTIQNYLIEYYNSYIPEVKIEASTGIISKKNFYYIQNDDNTGLSAINNILQKQGFMNIGGYLDVTNILSSPDVIDIPINLKNFFSVFNSRVIENTNKVDDLGENIMMNIKQIVTAMKLKGYEELNSEYKETARNIICKNNENNLWYAIKKIRELYYIFKDSKIIKINFADIETTYAEIIYFKDSNKTNLIAQLVEVSAAVVPAISSAPPITNILERTKIDEILKKKELSEEEKDHRVIDYFRAINWYSDMFLGKILKPAEAQKSAEAQNQTKEVVKSADTTKKNNSFSEFELNKWYYKWDAAPSLEEIKNFITKIDTIARSATTAASPAATSATITASPSATSATSATTAAPSKSISSSDLDFVPIKEKLLNFYFDYKLKEYDMLE